MPDTTNKALRYAHEASLGMPSSIKDVADFLLSEGTGIADLTMAQVAASVYTSKPTLVRFAKRAGYTGWKDYRHDFLLAMQEVERRRAEQADVDINYPFGEDAEPGEIVQSLIRIQHLATDEVQRHVSHTELVRTAHAILSAPNVMLIGGHQNHYRCQSFATNMCTIGILCHVPTADQTASALRALSEGDCVIMVSYSGSLNHGPFLFAPSLKEQGVHLVAVTNAQRSPLGGIAEYALTYRPLEHYHGKIGPFYSGACTTLILDLLYATCFSLRYRESDTSRRTATEGLVGIIPHDFASSE
ncbi:MAG: MurR/RpiR family transcriptional regulator [Atopobiaceae bacterium]|nr:MurR/RpiR family transcriptional regulator [Atopobiaceae bacterium]